MALRGLQLAPFCLTDQTWRPILCLRLKSRLLVALLALVLCFPASVFASFGGCSGAMTETSQILAHEHGMSDVNVQAHVSMSIDASHPDVSHVTVSHDQSLLNDDHSDHHDCCNSDDQSEQHCNMSQCYAKLPVLGSYVDLAVGAASHFVFVSESAALPMTRVSPHYRPPIL